MTRVALKALWSRKLRTFLTGFAIVLGVATITGTFVLTDSIRNAFDSIFTTIYRGTDAVVTGKAAFDVSEDSGVEVPSFPESLLGEVQGLKTVGAAVGGVGGTAQLIDEDGDVIRFGGAPNIGFSVDPTQPRFNSIVLKSGTWPKADQVAIDTSTASKKDIEPGQTIGVQGSGAERRMRVSGLFDFSSEGNIGGATLAAFNLPTAQRLFNKVGRLDQIRAAAAAGTTQAQLVSSIADILPPTAQVRTGDAQATEDASDTQGFINFLQGFLLAFGGIALFVGAFVIANSLSITVAQRTREFATLRTIGASRRQIRRSVLVESLVLGFVASISGVVLGLALAKGLFWLFEKAGFTLPNSGLLLETRTVIVALVVGVVVTVVASLRPARRATRVPPIAAVREGATLPPGRFARYRPIGSAVTGLLGFALLAYGLFGSGLSTAQILTFMGIGTVLVFFGVAFFSSQLVVPLAHLLGGPAARIGGAPGILARDNAMRNPQRTASTAAALMIGLALVTLVAMLAQGIRASFFDAVNKIWVTDYAVTAQNNYSPIPISVSEPLRVPRGVRVTVRGEVASMRESFGEMGFNLLLVVLLVYLVMAAQFGSWLDPLIVVVAAPLGLLGVAGTLWLTGTSLNVQSFMGVLLMIGISVSNSVLLVEFANRLRSEGVPRREAIIQAARTRLRPILMTTIATVLGLAPMAIHLHAGDEMNLPLARAVIGGLAGSTLLTLFVVPLLYLLLKPREGAS